MRRPAVHASARLAAVLLLVLVGSRADGQPPAPGSRAEREQGFVEALRREDPAQAERYTALRAAQEAAVADLERAQTRYNAGGPELRPVALPQLRQAQRKYVETSLALLDFLDAHDRRTLVELQQQIERMTRVRDERARSRAELERMLTGE
jgi:hypothetical protein